MYRCNQGAAVSSVHWRSSGYGYGGWITVTGVPSEPSFASGLDFKQSNLIKESLVTQFQWWIDSSRENFEVEESCPMLTVTLSLLCVRWRLVVVT